jgi:hypothetical protein
MKKARTTAADLTETLKQNWTKLPGPKYYDQFQFVILTKKDTYELYHKGEFIISRYCLNAVKEISTIILNDNILNEGRISKK